MNFKYLIFLSDFAKHDKVPHHGFLLEAIF